MVTLPLKRDLTVAYRTSLLVALLVVVVSAAGLAWGSTSLHGVDQNRLATATVDRLLHHAHVVLTEGASYRLAEATAGKGVVPLG